MKKAQPNRSLLETEITTTKVDRRSFLARAAGAGTLALGAAFTAACGEDCDSSDTGDPAFGGGDPADEDPTDSADADLSDEDAGDVCE